MRTRIMNSKKGGNLKKKGELPKVQNGTGNIYKLSVDGEEFCKRYQIFRSNRC